MSRPILHVDMDAFYASVEQRHDPSLLGKPVVVGGAAPRGVVSAASYEARRYGIHSAMPMVQAMRRCPSLVVLPVRMDHYADISRRVFDIFESFSPLVEPLSLDEAFIDVSASARLKGSGEQVARQIKARVREELGLVVSVGVAPNKFVAKIASDIGKPDGLVVVRPDEVQAFLRPLPVSRLFGVGAVTGEQLAGMGIRTIGQLADFPAASLAARLGDGGRRLHALAHGQDERPVAVERGAESMGCEDTFAQDLTDLDLLRARVLEQADRVAARLRAAGLQAGALVLKVKTADFKLRTRQARLPRPSSDGALLGHKACALLERLHRGGLGPVRLTGVTGIALVGREAPRQLELGQPEQTEGERLGQALDRINARFGRRLVVRGSSLAPGRGGDR